jgi:hypothetical protein
MRVDGVGACEGREWGAHLVPDKTRTGAESNGRKASGRMPIFLSLSVSLSLSLSLSVCVCVCVCVSHSALSLHTHTQRERERERDT